MVKQITILVHLHCKTERYFQGWKTWEHLWESIFYQKKPHGYVTKEIFTFALGTRPILRKMFEK